MLKLMKYHTVKVEIVLHVMALLDGWPFIRRSGSPVFMMFLSGSFDKEKSK